MNALTKYLSILAAVACLGTTGLRAEGDAKPDRKPDAPKRERGGDKERKERGPKLTDEERAKLKAAREAAEKDPAVIKAKADLDAAIAKAKEEKGPEARKPVMEARKALHEAMKAAMLKADPSIGEILKKMPAPGEGRGERGPRKGGDKPGKPGKDGEKHGDKPAAE